MVFVCLLNIMGNELGTTMGAVWREEGIREESKAYTDKKSQDLQQQITCLQERVVRQDRLISVLLFRIRSNERNNKMRRHSS
jgi:hypothetical protein